jgi:hypothetical protein
MINDRIQEKLGALKSMAERGTEHEALNAMLLLNRLCLKYGIEVSSIGSSEETHYQQHILDQGGTLPGWKKILGQAVAIGVGAYSYMSRRGNTSVLMVTGLPYQITVVASQFDYLVQCLERLSGPCVGRSAKNAFKLGAATRIYQRIKADNDPLQNPDYQEGLVFLGNAIAQARDFTQRQLEGTWTTSVSRYSNKAAYEAGYQQGGTVGLNQQMGTGLHLSGQL